MGYNGAFGFHNNASSFSGGLTYSGTWNALTNVPFLQSGVGTNGEYYIVSVAGTTNLDGVTDWLIGDWAIFNGTTWQKIDNSGISYQGTWDALTNTPTLTSSVGFDGHFYIVNVSGSTNLNGITSWLVGDWAIFTGGVWLKIDNTSGIGGSGTTNYISKFTGGASIGDSQLFDDGTNVGINNNTPTAKLDIKGIDILSTSFSLKITNSTPNDLFRVRNDGFVLVGESTINSYLWTQGLGGVFGFSNENGYPYLYLNSAFSNKFYISNGASGSNAFAQINTSNGNWLIGSPNTDIYNAILTDTKLTVQGIDSSSSNYGLKVQNSGGTDNLVVRNDGNVGIGTATPSEKLEVSGKTKTTNFQMTSGATTDYILTSSDSQGNGVWIPSYNLSTKDYGSFYDTTTQTGGTNTTQSFKFNSTATTKNISITNLTGITITHTGVYNIQFSAQLFDNTGFLITSNVLIWLRKNDVDVPNSNGRVVVGSNHPYVVAAWNYVEEFTSGDVINLMWSSDSINVTIVYEAVPSYGPAIPSVILTITQI